MRAFFLVLIALFVLILSCSNPSKSDADFFLQHGYTLNKEANFLSWVNGDTIVLVGLNPKKNVTSKSVFFPRDSTHSLDSIFKKKKFKVFKCADSVEEFYLYSSEGGNLYKILFWKSKIELSQLNDQYFREDFKD
ncbi:MAG TPA: hypothetical protein PK325_06225 [Cyclobacteriaceae bacterium]|nr:hypothetical protein [Cyclobacteriaceae bacterium]HMV09608.1 hypothetical protein [Cyclobacteriaceae bacterium]HMX01060.1 hypothetical protein [Cyclobacteriaceae bacterium]HMX51769.1 hypothetical protein [Cyclobacteriaceae bacterium]HMY91862.1 hypothetical protein [Cyclobacteriaceae bacterium]